MTTVEVTHFNLYNKFLYINFSQNLLLIYSYIFIYIFFKLKING